MTAIDYNDKVLDYLEYLGYPEYVQWFESKSVAFFIAKVTLDFYNDGMSYRIAALTIFGLTWVDLNRRQNNDTIPKHPSAN